jgi:hypothetical protein
VRRSAISHLRAVRDSPELRCTHAPTGGWFLWADGVNADSEGGAQGADGGKSVRGLWCRGGTRGRALPRARSRLARIDVSRVSAEVAWGLLADGHAGEIRLRQHDGGVRSWWFGCVAPGRGARARTSSGNRVKRPTCSAGCRVRGRVRRFSSCLKSPAGRGLVIRPQCGWLAVVSGP